MAAGPVIPHLNLSSLVVLSHLFPRIFKKLLSTMVKFKVVQKLLIAEKKLWCLS